MCVWLYVASSLYWANLVGTYQDFPVQQGAAEWTRADFWDDSSDCASACAVDVRMEPWRRVKMSNVSIFYHKYLMIWLEPLPLETRLESMLQVRTNENENEMKCVTTP